VRIPAAAAPEGEQSLRRWLDLGAAQAARLGAQPVPVVVGNRNEADEAELAALVQGAGLIYGRGDRADRVGAGIPQQAWILTKGSRSGYPAGSWLTTP
jgi:hypothetical protein